MDDLQQPLTAAEPTIVLAPLYHGLANLLRYPDDCYGERIAAAEAALAAVPGLPVARLRRFADAVDHLPVTALQELFCSTFDLNPLCALEVGWQLFGEDYKRGAFLVSMRQELLDHEIVEQCELADHLIHILPLLAAQEPERADGLATIAILPAVEKMRQGLEGKDNPYVEVLAAIEETLRQVHGVVLEVS